jgi:acetyl esterase/lipase
MASMQSKLMLLFVRHVLTNFIKWSSLKQSRKFFDIRGRSIRLPRQLKREKVDAGGVAAEFLSGPDAKEDKVLVYLHGGGFCLGSSDAYRSAAVTIAQAAKMRLFIMDYRLAPEFPYPCGLNDIVAAYKWLLEHGISPKNIALAGDSAGGNLVVAAALSLREKKILLPGALVCLSPWLDLSKAREGYVTKANSDLILTPKVLKELASYYVGNNNYQDPLISPSYADLTGLPPILIQVGSREIILDDATGLAEHARNAGVDVTLQVWEDMWHIWQVLEVRLPESKRAIREIGDFMRKHLKEI